MSIEVVGTRIILDNLDALEEIIKAAVHEKMEDAATVGLQVAEDLVPVDTGFLRSRLDVEVRDDQIIFTDDADYALFVELGTSKQTAQPFIVPGATAAGDYLMSNLSGIL